MKKQLEDRKNWLGYSFLNVVNELTLRFHFRSIEILGKERIPDSPFVLVSNHISRFDGLLVQHALARKTNYLVTPHELKGVQGAVLPWVGAFPANPRYDLVGYALKQFEKGEGLVVFPEGNIFLDGVTHPFKPGAARIALVARTQGVPITVLPAALRYDDTPQRTARMIVGDPVSIDDYLDQFAADPQTAMKSMSVSLHREVCHLRAQLGVARDREQVMIGNPVRTWMPRQITVNNPAIVAERAVSLPAIGMPQPEFNAMDTLAFGS
ncbi:MAG TPA: lysophospholipid acyltransferase family protein [Candidatus Obscuribacterales bacterium]